MCSGQVILHVAVGQIQGGSPPGALGIKAIEGWMLLGHPSVVHRRRFLSEAFYDQLGPVKPQNHLGVSHIVGCQRDHSLSVERVERRVRNVFRPAFFGERICHWQ